MKVFCLYPLLITLCLKRKKVLLQTWTFWIAFPSSILSQGILLMENFGGGVRFSKAFMDRHFLVMLLRLDPYTHTQMHCVLVYICLKQMRVTKALAQITTGRTMQWMNICPHFALISIRRRWSALFGFNLHEKVPFTLKYIIVVECFLMLMLLLGQTVWDYLSPSKCRRSSAFYFSFGSCRQ